MLDDEILPENHPLQLYLSKLELDEPFENSPLRSVTRPLRVEWNTIIASLQCQGRRLFHFADACRSDMLETLSYMVENDTTLRQLCSSPDTCYRLSSCLLMHLSLIPVLVFGTQQSYSTCFLLFSYAASCLLTLSLSMVFWIALLRRALQYIHRAISTSYTQSRACVMFLQELHLHSLTDASDINSTDYPQQLLLGLWYYLRMYSRELIEICLNIEKPPQIGVFLHSIPKANLEFIKERLNTKHDPEQPVALLSDCKMLREITRTLNSESVHSLFGLMYSTPAYCLFTWLKIGLILRRWAWAVYSFERQTILLDKIRAAIECGQMSLDKDRIMQQARSDQGDETGRNSSEAGAKKLLLHLLAAVIKTQELVKTLQHATVPFESDVSTLLTYLKLQLGSCQTQLTELERFLNGDSSDDNISTPASQAQDHGPSSVVHAKLDTRTTTIIPASDVTPEDDVVEDVAVGNEDDTNPVDQIASVLPSMMPLHASVLDELRLAIADRRVQMHRRERIALQKRLQSAAQSEPKDNLLQEPNCSPMVVRGSQALIADGHTRDAALDRFFSSAEHTPTTLHVDQANRNNRPWHIPSAVEKRVNVFCRAQRRRMNTAVRPDPLPKSPETTQSQPIVNPVKPNPLSGASFAAALLAQRKTIGYAEEDAFVATGDGPDEILSSPNDLMSDTLDKPFEASQ